MSLPQFEYNNTEVIKNQSGGKIVRKVFIKQGNGYKSVGRYHKRKHTGTIRKKLKPAEIQMIKVGKFIPGLFNDCKTCSNKKTKPNQNTSTRRQK